MLCFLSLCERPAQAKKNAEESENLDEEVPVHEAGENEGVGYVSSNNDTKHSISPEFEADYDAWDKKSKGGYFKLGSTSKALESVGINPSDIYWDKSKIEKIQKEHPEMTDDVIKQIPYLLEYPVMVMQSQTVANRVVVFGEVYADGKPVLCALELKPNGQIDNFIKVASAYSKDGVQGLINTSDILYLDPDKNRTDNWLSALRLQLPAGVTNYGSIGSVTYSNRNVKGEIVFDSKTETKSAIEEALERAGYTTDQGGQERDMQNSENDARKTTSEGKRWSVAGENSYDADLSALDEAILRIRDGDDRNAVIRDTGWWLGKDGKWRYEISNEKMEYDPNGFYDNPQTLGDYVKHDNLFRAYPFLRDIKVKFANAVSNDPTALGEYDMEENTITVKKGLTTDDVKKTFLHELQHAVQRYENFIEGSSWDVAAVGLFNMAYKTIKDSEQYKRLKTPNERLNFVKRYTIKRGNPSFAKQAFSLYFENYGEVEARATENRLKMTEEERRLNPIENDGFVYSVRKIKSGFIDNLRSMGYNEGQINNFLEKGIFHGNQSRNVSESLREDGQHGGVEGNVERSSGTAMRGGEGSRVSRTGDLQTGEGGKTDGNLREDSIKYSVSDETEVDDGALSYEELEKEVASLREKNRALIQELHLSHGKVLDGKAVRAHLKDVIDSFGGTVKVQEIENDFQTVMGI